MSSSQGDIRDGMDDLGPPPARLPGSSGFLSSGSLPGPTLYTQVASTTSGNAGAAGTQGQDGATEASEEKPWDCLFTHKVKWGKNSEGQETVNEYVLLGELGRGSFGRVQLCERRVGPAPWRRFAMKIMSKQRLRRLSEYVNSPLGGMRKITAEDKMRQEIDVMRRLYHRNVVILFEVLEADDDDPTNVDDEELVCMIGEYMEGGATMTYEEESGVFKRAERGIDGTRQGFVYSEDEAKPLFRDLVEGLLYLHRQGIVHRDIKPDNLLLFENGALRICDFGCARRIKIARCATGDAGSGAGEMEEEEGLTDSIGTYTFHSPESVSGDGRAFSGRAADAWAAACTLYCWTFGHLPFEDDALEPLFAKIRGEELQVGRAVSPELASLLQGMLRKDPTKRIGLDAVHEHPWMRGVPDPAPPAGFRPSGT